MSKAEKEFQNIRNTMLQLIITGGEVSESYLKYTFQYAPPSLYEKAIDNLLSENLITIASVTIGIRIFRFNLPF